MKNQWLEDEIPFGVATFQGYVSFRECKSLNRKVLYPDAPWDWHIYLPTRMVSVFFKR